MALNDTNICCCGASIWANVVAGLQMGLSVLTIIGACWALQKEDTIENSFAEKKEDKMDGILTLIVIGGFLWLGLGILLYIGNKKERLELLWIWLISAVIGTAVDAGVVIFPIVVEDAPKQVQSILIPIVIRIFSIYIVHQRIKDIKMASGDSVEASPIV